MFLVSLIGPWKRSRHEACLETKLCSDLVGCFYGFIFGAGIFCVFIDPFFGTRFGPQNQVGDSSYMCYTVGCFCFFLELLFFVGCGGVLAENPCLYDLVLGSSHEPRNRVEGATTKSTKTATEGTKTATRNTNPATRVTKAATSTRPCKVGARTRGQRPGSQSQLPELPELSEQTRQSKARRGKARQGEARNMSHQGSNMRHQSSNQEALKAISMFVGRFWTEI